MSEEPNNCIDCKNVIIQSDNLSCKLVKDKNGSYFYCTNVRDIGKCVYQIKNKSIVFIEDNEYMDARGLQKVVASKIRIEQYLKGEKLRKCVVNKDYIYELRMKLWDTKEYLDEFSFNIFDAPDILGVEIVKI